MRYFDGTPSPVRKPELVDMVILEKSEDIYAGVEFKADTEEARSLIRSFKSNMVLRKLGFQRAWNRY